jgi:hypothetical protein
MIVPFCVIPRAYSLNKILRNSWATIEWSIPRECNWCTSGTLERDASRCRRNSGFLTGNFIAKVACSNAIESFYLKLVPNWMSQPCSSERSFAIGFNLLPIVTLIIPLINRVARYGRSTIVSWSGPRQQKRSNSLTLHLEICRGIRDSNASSLRFK